MKQLTIKSLDVMPEEELSKLFSEVFMLENLPFHDEGLLPYLVELSLKHSIPLALDTAAYGKYSVSAKPKAHRANFSDLRHIYFQGLKTELVPVQFRDVQAVQKFGKTINIAIMKTLLTLALNDAYSDD